jgi:hypothetical protein
MPRPFVSLPLCDEPLAFAVSPMMACPSTRCACSGHHSPRDEPLAFAVSPMMACHEQALSTAKGASNGGGTGNRTQVRSGVPGRRCSRPYQNHRFYLISDRGMRATDWISTASPGSPGGSMRIAVTTPRHSGWWRTSTMYS